MSEYSATWAAETLKREAEKAPAILVDFGCNVEENTCMHSASFLSTSLKDLECEIEEISVHEMQCMHNS
jgi:hypothetical protein